MKKITVNIAGIPIGIEYRYDKFENLLLKFATEESPEFEISVNDADIESERKKSIEEYMYEQIPCPKFSEADYEFTAVYRKIADILPKYNAVVFHGSAVAVDGEAFLFTAKSGTGKTTHTNLWLKNIKDSYVVNGDKPVLRFYNKKAYVCGTPWMGKEKLGRNDKVPLKSICILKRGSENKIYPTTIKESFPIFVGQTYRPPETSSLLSTLKTLETILNNVKLFILECNMEDEAAFVSYEGMKNM